MSRLAVVVAVLLTTAACSGGPVSAPLTKEESSATTEAAKAAPARRAVLGLLGGEEGRVQLTRLHPVTLKPSGRSVELRDGAAVARSPDRRTLVLTNAVHTGPAGPQDRAELSFVDLERMRIDKVLDLPAGGWVSTAVWRRPSRLVVLLGGEPPRVVVVDPHAPRVVDTRPLEGSIVATDAKAGRVAALLAPAERIGPSRLVVVEADGAMRAMALPSILAGSEPMEHPDDPHATRERSPGLALSPDGERAVVVPPGGRVAEVDLDSLAVSYHELGEPVSLLGRLRSWLEPEAEAKVSEGPTRHARWLGDHHVAVTGMDYHGAAGDDVDDSPAGLRLVDTRDWSVRTVAEDATSMIVVRDLVLAFGGPYTEYGGTGIGLRGYGADGEERFHVLGNDWIGWLETAWPYGYVLREDGTKVDVFDLRGGRLVRTATVDRYVSVVGG